MVRPDPVDPELVAALLDGALSPADRAQALERLARSPEDYELFVESAALLRDLDADGAGAPPRPVALPATLPSMAAVRPRRWMTPALVGLPLAAVLAGVLVLSGNRGVRAEDLLGSVPPVLAPGWDQIPGSSTRGSPESAEQAREFQIGAYLAQVEIAFDAGDAVAAENVLGELGELLGRLDGGGATEGEYAALQARTAPGTPVDGLESDRVRARESLVALLRDSPWFELGLWAEQARLATLANQPGFFSERAVRVLDRLAARVAEERDEEDRLVSHLRKLQRLLADGASPSELRAIRATLTDVMKEVGG